MFNALWDPQCSQTKHRHYKYIQSTVPFDMWVGKTETNKRYVLFFTGVIY